MNNKGQCGIGTNENLSKPVQIPFFKDKEVTKIAAGGFHSLAVCFDQTLYGWGEGVFGQLGNSQFFDQVNPVKVAIQNNRR